MGSNSRKESLRREFNKNLVHAEKLKKESLKVSLEEKRVCSEILR